MPLQLSTRTKCRRRPDFGIQEIPPTARRVTACHVVTLYLKAPGQTSAIYRWTVPHHTPDRRVRKARDYILAKIDAGGIHNREDWSALCRKLSRKIRALNHRDGIRPLKTGPRPSALVSCVL